MAGESRIQARFEYERGRKNTILYKELAVHDTPMVGALYIKKAALGDKPRKRLTVTVEEQGGEV